MPQPNLLINGCPDPAVLADRVCSAPVSPLDTVTPTARFRGTLIHKESAGDSTVIGWQRNFARIRQVDVSLPTVIMIRLHGGESAAAMRIGAVTLDNRFRGSKGILCSASYLDRIMRDILIGRLFNRDLLKTVRLEHLHCFHLVEVLTGMISFFEIMRETLASAPDGSGFHEEEVSDHLMDGDNVSHICGYHTMHGRPPVSYTLSMRNCFDRIRFTGDGALRGGAPLPMSFSLQDELLFEREISIGTSGIMSGAFQKLLLECTARIRDAFGIDGSIPFRCSNLFPAAFMGLFTQTIAIRQFHNNYQYIMHALTGLQRRDGVPLCVGASSDAVELERHFPRFTSHDLN